MGNLTQCSVLVSESLLGFTAADNGSALPSGSACFFYGKYEYTSLSDVISPHITAVPPSHCILQPQQSFTGMYEHLHFLYNSQVSKDPTNIAACLLNDY